MRQPASSDPRKQLVESGYDRIAERYLAWASGIADPGRARMLDLLLERLAREQLPDAELVHADLASVEFPDACFDGVTCF